LGAKYLVVLCAGSTLLLAKQSQDEATYKLSGAVAKLGGITFRRLAFSWIRLNLGFLLRENSLLYSSNLPLGVPNWTVIYTITHRHSKDFSSAVAGEKEYFCKGSFARTSFTLFIVLLYFIFTFFVLSKTQKKLVSY
jgi:hypothetical protein